MNPKQTKPKPETIRDWLDAHADLDAPAFHFPFSGDILTWTKFLVNVRRLASHLTAQGMTKGESVAILHPNDRDGVIALYSVFYAGFRAVLINPEAGNDTIDDALEQSNARFAFIHPDAEARLQTAKAAQGITRIDKDGAMPTPLFQLLSDDPAFQIYPTGSMNKVKPVIHTHASLLAEAWLQTDEFGLVKSDLDFLGQPTLTGR